MKERDIAGRVLKMIRDDPRFDTCAVEVKVSKWDSLPAAALKPHQRRALVLASKQRLSWKISDDTFGQKPFDGFVLKRVAAYVVIVWGSMKDIEAVPVQEFPETGSYRKRSAVRGSVSIASGAPASPGR